MTHFIIFIPAFEEVLRLVFFCEMIAALTLFCRIMNASSTKSWNEREPSQHLSVGESTCWKWCQPFLGLTCSIYEGEGRNLFIIDYQTKLKSVACYAASLPLLVAIVVREQFSGAFVNEISKAWYVNYVRWLIFISCWNCLQTHCFKCVWCFIIWQTPTVFHSSKRIHWISNYIQACLCMILLKVIVSIWLFGSVWFFFKIIFM
jgi:hypothetical protein